MVLLLIQKAITTCVTGQNKTRGKKKDCYCLSGTVIRAAMSPAAHCMPPVKVWGFFGSENLLSWYTRGE